MKILGILNRLSRFGRDQGGAATAEVVMWTPIFLVIFGMIADTSIVFGRQAEILRILQDSNRLLAVGRFLTVQEAQTYIEDRVEVFSDNSDVVVTVNDGIIASSVTLPATDLTSTGLFDAINALSITMGASQMSEV